MASYIASTVASGVAGNLAYDMLKKAVRRKTPRLASVPDDHLLPELVFHAVTEQCRRFELTAPAVSSMRVDRWETGPMDITAFVSCQDSDLTAKVTVPRRGSGSLVEMWVRDFTQSPTIERVARNAYIAQYGLPRGTRSFGKRVLLVVSVLLLIGVAFGVVTPGVEGLRRLF